MNFLFLSTGKALSVACSIVFGRLSPSCKTSTKIWKSSCRGEEGTHQSHENVRRLEFT